MSKETKEKKIQAVAADLDLDLFGVLEEEADDYHDKKDPTSPKNLLGPPSRWPPQYQRDKTTGRLSTQNVQAELSDRDRLVLKADAVERDQLTLENVERHFLKKKKKKADNEESEEEEEDLVDEWGKRVRETNMSLNVLGRSVPAQRSKEVLDDGSTLGRDQTGFSTPFLTQSEFASFQKYMKQTQHISRISKEDLPVQEGTRGGGKDRKSSSSSSKLNPVDTVDGDEYVDYDEDDDGAAIPDDVDDARLSLKWLTQRAQRQMDDLALDDNPYSDLMPGDLSPVRLVNRKRAKPIPRQLLHHNNVELLKYFLTPTGQIQNRVKTRLGARDQRKISKLIKRARAIGLIPHVGQFKVEQHGWIHAKDIHQDRDWEKELVQRGLVITRKSKDKSIGNNNSRLLESTSESTSTSTSSTN